MTPTPLRTRAAAALALLSLAACGGGGSADAGPAPEPTAWAWSLPAGFAPQVVKGQRAVAGETVLAVRGGSPAIPGPRQ